MSVSHPGVHSALIIIVKMLLSKGDLQRGSSLVQYEDTRPHGETGTGRENGYLSNM